MNNNVGKLVCLLIFAVTVAFVRCGAMTNLVSEMPIEFQPVEFRFYKHTNETAHQTEVTEEERKLLSETKDKLEKMDKSSLCRDTSIASHTQIDIVGVPFAGGAAASQTQIDFNNRISSMASSETSALSTNDKSEVDVVRNALREEINKKSGNWMFTVKGRFINKTPECYSCAPGEIATILVGVPGAEISAINTNGFLVLPNNDKGKTVEFTREITEDDYKSVLIWCLQTGKLNSQFCRVRIEADFPLKGEKGSKAVLAFHSLASNPITIDVRFDEGYRTRFPLRVTQVNNEKDLSIKDALIAVAKYCKEKTPGDFSSEERIFKFANGKLGSVFDVPLGVLKSDGIASGEVKMLLMRQNGQWRTSADEKLLSTIPSGNTFRKSIVFDFVNIADLVKYPAEFSAEVKKTFIEELKKLNEGKDKNIALGLMYSSVGDKGKMIEFFANAAGKGMDLSKLRVGGEPIFWSMILNGTVQDVKNVVNLRNVALIKEANTYTNKTGATIISELILNDAKDKYVSLTKIGVKKCGTGNYNHLVYASECGSTNIITYLIEEAYDKIDVNVVDDSGESPLMKAARRGHLNVCKYLIAHGADIKLKSRVEDNECDVMCDPEVNGCEDTRKYIDAMRDLLKCQTWWFGEPSYSVKRIRKYLAAGIPADYRWDFKAYKTTHYSDKGWTFMRWAIYNADEDGVIDLIKLLIANGADVNSALNGDGKQSPLKCAITGKNVPLVKLLLDSGAKYNVEDIVVDVVWNIYDAEIVKRILSGIVAKQWMIDISIDKANYAAFSFLIENASGTEQAKIFEELSRRKISDDRIRECVQKYSKEKGGMSK